MTKSNEKGPSDAPSPQDVAASPAGPRPQMAKEESLFLGLLGVVEDLMDGRGELGDLVEVAEAIGMPVFGGARVFFEKMGTVPWKIVQAERMRFDLESPMWTPLAKEPELQFRPFRLVMETYVEGDDDEASPALSIEITPQFIANLQSKLDILETILDDEIEGIDVEAPIEADAFVESPEMHQFEGLRLAKPHVVIEDGYVQACCVGVCKHGHESLYASYAIPIEFLLEFIEQAVMAGSKRNTVVPVEMFGGGDSFDGQLCWVDGVAYLTFVEALDDFMARVRRTDLNS